LISGCAVFAGGPYDCAGGSEETALTTCMEALPFAPDPQLSILTTDLRGSSGAIDPVSNIQKAYVYMYSGTLDSTVHPVVMTALYDYYLNYIPGDQIQFQNTTQSAHTQPTDEPVDTNPCWLSISPYISDCNYDGAGMALNHIFGAPLPNARNDGTLTGQLIEFDQGQFIPGGAAPSSLSLAQTGWAYVPASCSQGAACKIHVSFHGCEQCFNSVGLDYVLNTGYNKWADTNNIVMVYPQTVASFFPIENPSGCWDWWGGGYTGSSYDVQAGPQIQFALNMLKQAAPHNKP